MNDEIDKNDFSVVKANLTHTKYLAEFGRKSFIDAYLSALPYHELEKYTQNAFSQDFIYGEIVNSCTEYFICQDLQQSNPYGYLKLIQSDSPKCIPSTKIIELQRLYVDEQYQGLGISKKLHISAVNYAKKIKMEGIYLRVWEKNTLALSIYSKWGYEILSKEKYQVGEGYGIVHIMYKVL